MSTELLKQVAESNQWWAIGPEMILACAALGLLVLEIITPKEQHGIIPRFAIIALAMVLVTLVYTWFGGLKAVVWADEVQLVVSVSGGIAALFIAWDLAGGAGAALDLAAAAGKLRIVDPTVNLTSTYTLLGGIVGGAMLSAASHGTDHLIVQRLLATRSLRDAQRALVGSGIVVTLQFLLFLLVGSAIWAAGFAPDSLPGDSVFPRFIVEHLPRGLAGLVVAGILAAAMSTISSSINALASAVTHDI
jgi:Na+/proline symporter